MAYLDLIVFAVIAALLLMRLRSVLGERDDNDVPDFGAQNKDNPMSSKKELSGDSGDDQMAEPMRHAVKDAVYPPAARNTEQSGERWAQNLPDYAVVATATAHNRLVPFLAADPRFRPDVFLEKAQKAFDMVLGAYSEGALNTLEFLLAPSLYQAFAERIATRQEKNESFNIQLHAIQKAVISDAELDGTHARVTVDFTSEQAINHRDASGDVIGESDGRRRVIKDRWTFKKDLKDSSPVWLVVQTGAVDD